MGDLLEWFRTLTWRCDFCGEERPDKFISVWKVDESAKYGLGGGTWIHNWKYCNDRPACSDAAKSI